LGNRPNDQCRRTSPTSGSMAPPPPTGNCTTNLAEHDLHFLTRLQTESFPNGLQDSYLKFW
jgi:hypothetical protein